MKGSEPNKITAQQVLCNGRRQCRSAAIVAWMILRGRGMGKHRVPAFHTRDGRVVRGGEKKASVRWPSFRGLAGGLGFEPRLAESESAVLPLDDPPMSGFAARNHLHSGPCAPGPPASRASCFPVPGVPETGSLQRAAVRGPVSQRLEYCGRLRALCSPTFLRSTSRASRVTNPARRSWAFRLSSYSTRARVMPWRMAPA